MLILPSLRQFPTSEIQDFELLLRPSLKYSLFAVMPSLQKFVGSVGR